MSSKKETLILTLSTVITLSILAGGWWWLTLKNQNHLASLTEFNPDSPENITPLTLKDLQNVPTGLFSYGGSTSWAQLRIGVNAALEKSAPQFQLRYTDPLNEAPSSKTGIDMLLNSQLDFALSSRPLSDGEYEKAKERGIRLKAIPVAIDGITIAVHPDLNIPGITLSQFDQIYKTGTLKNWQQLGGPNIPIRAYGKKGRDSQEHIILTSTTTEALRGVASDPGGIYWASAPLLVPQCMVKTLPVGRTPQQLIPPYQLPLIPPEKCTNTNRNKVNVEAFRTGEYPWTRRLFVVINENGKSQQEAGEFYANLLLSPQGKKLVTQAGLVSLQ